MKKPDYLHVAIAYWIGFLVFICFYFYFNKRDAYRKSVKTDAVVVERLWGSFRGKRSSSTGYYPQFKFTYNDTDYLSADHNIWFSNKRPGQKLKVIFPEGQPNDAEIYSLFTYWVDLPKFFVGGIVALFFFCIPFVVNQYRLFKKEFKHKRL